MQWLLVDDNPQMAVIVRILLRRSGHSLAVASDIPTATRLLADSRPDLILLDVNLPGTSGLDWLRTQGERPTVALFIQSSLVNDLAAGWDAGVDYAFAKELVTDSSGWQGRVDEILAHREDPSRFGLLSTIPPVTLAAWWNKALDRALGRVPVVLVVSLLRRALRNTFGEQFRSSWVNAQTGRLDDGVASCPVPQSCGDVLLNDTGRLLGGEAARALFAALTRTD